MEEIGKNEKKKSNVNIIEGKKENLKKKCEHGNEKYRCIKCGGSGICIHKLRKEYCINCKGSQLCIHNKEKRYCNACIGSQICIHNTIKSICKVCKGKHKERSIKTG